MQQQGKLITRIFVIILCLLSMLGCSLIIWTFSKTPKLSKNPGSIILRMSIAQLLITFNLLFAQFYYNDEENYSAGFEISEGFCQFLGIIEIFSGSEYILYNVFFATNLYCSLKKDNYNFQKYFFYMEVLSCSGSLAIAFGFFFFSDLSINLAGVCGVSLTTFKALSIILAIIMVCMIIIVIMIMLEKSPFKNPLYNRNQEKFQRKYHHEFKVINLLYITVFMITYLIPCCLMYWSSLFQKKNAYDFLPLINPLGGILLFVIRINDPIVKKCLFIILSGDRKRSSCKLKDKLIQKKDVLLVLNSIEPGLEISTCPQNNIRYTIKQVSDKQSSEDSSFKTTFGSGYQTKLIKNSQDIFIILLSIKNAMNNSIQNNTSFEKNQKQLKSHHFLNLTHHELYLQDDPRELDVKLREPNNLSLKDFINPNNYKRIINCYSYASKTLIYWFSQLLNIDINQFKLSLQVSQNAKKIAHLKLPTSYGPIMLTYDHYFSIELISKKQKMMLTKGGALMNICKRYQAEYGKANNGNTLLPALFGLYTIQLDEEKFVNVVLRLNQIKIEFPLTRLAWNIPEEQNQLIQQNVFGWTQLSVKEGVSQLLVAEQLQEGKFVIKIEDNDFKLSNNAAKELLQILTRDIEALQFVKNPKISFVYFKFPNNRLDSMCNHENSLSFHYQIIKNSQQITPLQMAACLSSLGQFELDGKLGYVRIFFDDLWKAEWESMEDEERYQQFQSLIQQVTEIV